LLEQLGSFITSWILGIGYPAIFILMTIESALIPIPSEVTMPFAGFLVGTGRMEFIPVVFFGALGNLFGSLLSYALGYWGQKNYVKGLIKKYGKYLLISYDDVETAERWFCQKGELIAFTSRLLPVVRTFISLPAGFSKMNWIRFSIFTFLGAFIWSALLAYIGLILGENWHQLGSYFHKFDVLIVMVIIILGIIYIHHKIKKIRRS
jgi:membrane protein DedA with SNARE-associated domain